MSKQEIELSQAADQVNRFKAAYDQCEHLRMQDVMNGGDSQTYSCEREFESFKKAFDVQLSLESKMPIVIPAAQPTPK